MYTQVSDPVTVTYDDQELKELIDKYLSDIDGEFSYQGVCRHVVNEAKRNSRVEGAPNTRYTSNEISIPDGIRISKILWEKIWDKEIIIAFGENKYRTNYPGDTRLYKL